VVAYHVYQPARLAPLILHGSRAECRRSLTRYLYLRKIHPRFGNVWLRGSQWCSVCLSRELRKMEVEQSVAGRRRLSNPGLGG